MNWPSCMEPFHVYFWLFFVILKQVPIYFRCLGEFCRDDLLLRTRKVLWTAKIHPAFHQQRGVEHKMTEFSFLGELIL